MNIYFISICCVCHKVLGKVITKAYKHDVISHGLCDLCAKKEHTKIDKMIKENKI